MLSNAQFNSTDPTGKLDRPANWGANGRSGGREASDGGEAQEGSPQLPRLSNAH